MNSVVPPCISISTLEACTAPQQYAYKVPTQGSVSVKCAPLWNASTPFVVLCAIFVYLALSCSLLHNSSCIIDVQMHQMYLSVWATLLSPQLHMQVTDMNQYSSNMLMFMNLQFKESPSTNSDLRLEVQSEKKLLTVKSWFTRFKCYIISLAFKVVHRLLPCCSISTSSKASKGKRVWDTPLVQG